MTKSDLINIIAKRSGLKKEDVKNAMEISIEEIQNALKKGESVGFLGFGVFEVKKVAKRVGMNPKTKERVDIPSRKQVKFRPGRGLKEIVK